MLKEHPGNENVTVLSIDAAQIYSLLFSEIYFNEFDFRNVGFISVCNNKFTDVCDVFITRLVPEHPSVLVVCVSWCSKSQESLIKHV